MKGRVEISVVSPVYCAASMLPDLVHRIESAIKPIGVSFELILVDDRSPDESWKTILELTKMHSWVRGFRLSRNFGQHYAITAGLGLVNGKRIVVMDCDLQDRPEEIPNLYDVALKTNANSVIARRVERQDAWLKRASSKAYYTAFSYLTDTNQDPSIANFGIYDRSVILAVLSMKDQIRYFPTMLQWVGFDRVYVDVKHSARAEGESSYNWKSLFGLAFNNILAFSDKPLRLVVQMGFVIATASLGVGLYFFVLYIIGEIVVLGFPTLIISISFFSGMIIMILGMIGLYLGKIFEKVKDRPMFIISETSENG